MDKQTIERLRLLALDDTDEAVISLRDYLRQFGFASADDARVFSASTSEALKAYQSAHGLVASGTVDAPTAALIAMPRCGVPDISVSFVTSGLRWSRADLTYGFRQFTGQLTQEAIRTAVRQAADTWSAAAPLRFREVDPAVEAADIEITFAAGDHGDDSPFDGAWIPGQSTVLAHAFYPPPANFAGDMHFDDDETWSLSLPPNGFDFVTVALHELGHSLGLDHSPVREAVMYAGYDGPRRNLHADDIAGIRALYPFLWEARDLFTTVQADTGGNPVQAAGDPFGYIDATGRSSVQHVFYRGADGHIHELAWNPVRWEARDLFATVQADTGYIPEVSVSNPTAYIDPTERSSVQHVFFRGADGHLHELAWNPTRWETRDLTIESNGAPMVVGSPTAFTDPTGRSSVQHIFCRTSRRSIAEFAWNPPQFPRPPRFPNWPWP